MSEPESFLSRWSRRKREAALPEAPAEALTSGSAENAAADPVVLSEEELAKLPKLEELTAESDVSAFLRPGVPLAIRNAALRRIWLLDPKIRDFVCEAREYAYDWNVPGGVPGYGPLPADLDVKALTGRFFRQGQAPPPTEERAASEAPKNEIQATCAARSEDPARLAATASPETDPGSRGACDSAAEAAATPAAADPPAAIATVASTLTDAAGPPRRRHGGALPV